MSLEQHSVTLSATNRRKMEKGEPTLLTHEQITGGPDTIFLAKRQSNKLRKSIRLGKGCKITLTAKERQASLVTGDGLSWKGFKRGARRFAKKAAPIAKEIWHEVKPVVAPYIKKGVHAGVGFLAGAAASAAGAPEFAPAAADLLNQGADSVAHKIGAYGLRAHRRGPACPGCGRHAHEAWTLSSGSHPTHQFHDTRFRSPMIQGGSFLPV